MPAAEVRRLLAEHGLRPSRALGQNFVVDPNTVRRIARLAGIGPGDKVVEIGAGLGSLTGALAETGASVTVVEVDRHLVPLLASVVPPEVSVVQADALTLDWTELLGDAGGWRLVGNLPYNVATPLVVRVLEEAPQVDSLLVMVQKEVGERLAARAGDDAYGAVSVKVAYWATASVVGTVPPTVFFPRPAVDSALVRIDRRADPAVEDIGYDRLFSVVAAGFAQRRKMLRRSLAGVVTPEAFGAAGVAPTARAEELDVAAWGEAGPVIVRAPAKLTVSLRVTGVRPDGYHELESEMVALDLCDTLEIADGDGLTIVDEGPWPSGLGNGPDNIVRRALQAVGRSATVRLRKRIPVGGGLGGGSTDAAAVLRWAGCTDPTVAARLGADVPFCVVGGRALVSGIGERVAPLPYTDRRFTLLTPPLSVNTAAAYRAWDLLGGDGANELTAAALSVEPALAAWRDAFGAATGREPLLAGSGSTWWVEGECDRDRISVGGQWAPLVAVRSVPAGWS